jgi:putative redox protein
MAVIIEGTYIGDKRTRMIHGPSGAEMLTDAPADNAGEGRCFSPTDLVAAGLGSCILTIMAIYAERNGIDLAGSTLRVTKEMTSNPRRLGRITVELHLPSGICPEDRVKLERAGHACPVERSLHPDVAVDIRYAYDI